VIDGGKTLLSQLTDEALDTTEIRAVGVGQASRVFGPSILRVEMINIGTPFQG
jgi:hypothetical protein